MAISYSQYPIIDDLVYIPFESIVGYIDSHMQSGLQLTISSSANCRFVSSCNSLNPAANNDSSFQSMLPPGGTQMLGKVRI